MKATFVCFPSKKVIKKVFEGGLDAVVYGDLLFFDGGATASPYSDVGGLTNPKSVQNARKLPSAWALLSRLQSRVMIMSGRGNEFWLRPATLLHHVSASKKGTEWRLRSLGLTVLGNSRVEDLCAEASDEGQTFIHHLDKLNLVFISLCDYSNTCYIYLYSNIIFSL